MYNVTSISTVGQNVQFSQDEGDLKLLKESPLQDLIDGKCDGAFNRLIAQCQNDHAKAKEVAYALFSGPRAYRARECNIAVQGLNYLLVDPELSTPDLVCVLSRAYHSFKEDPIPPAVEMSDTREAAKWGGYSGEVYEEEELVTVHHGGGRRHVEAFLKGETGTGYRCDSSLVGIFVTPISKADKAKLVDEATMKYFLLFGTRAVHYATYMPLRHCDDAYVIAGDVPKKYLYSVDHNSNVAVLRKEDAARLTRIFSLTINASVDQMIIINQNKFFDLFIDDPVLQDRLRDAFFRLYA